MGANTPGQSGDVTSPHYRDLFELWKNDRYFPVKYSRPAVEGVTELYAARYGSVQLVEKGVVDVFVD